MRFRSDPARIRGSMGLVATPFTRGGEPDHTGLRRLVRWQIAAGSHGVPLGGSTGEPAAQTVEERIAVMRVAALLGQAEELVDGPRERTLGDLGAAETFFTERNCRVRRVPAGVTLGVGDAVRVEDPLGFTVEFFHDI